MVIGCVIAFQSLYIWDLHVQVNHLEAQVAQLTAESVMLRKDLCTYQMLAEGLNARLNALGRKPVTIPPAYSCPPPGKG